MPPPQGNQSGRRPLSRTSAAANIGNAPIQREVILLAVTGMSPAILTETVWALAEEDPPVIPHRIVVLTTTAGKKQIETELFTRQAQFDGQCGWDCLRHKLEEDGSAVTGRLKLDPESDDLRVFMSWDEHSKRRPRLTDIRTAAENEAIADCILETVRGIVTNPDTNLIASIAGGRKTMGTLLYACMTLIGRETDRVTHVLVSEPFDDPKLKPRFYFPAQPLAELTAPDQRKVSAADARLSLADVPFVPLRNQFLKELGRMPGSFSTLVVQCREQIKRPAVELVVYRTRPEIDVNGKSVKLSAKEQCLILFLANRLSSGQPAFSAFKLGEDSLNVYLEEVLRRQADPENFADWRDGISKNFTFDEREITKSVSSIRAKLKKAGPPAMALLPYLPETGRLSLDLFSSQVAVKD